MATSSLYQENAYVLKSSLSQHIDNLIYEPLLPSRREDMRRMFRYAKSNRVFEDIVEQIQEAILEGKLQEGEKLPAERELQEIFKTSRGTLREALRVLEQRGLIEIKRGVSGGVVVKKITTDEISESLALLIRSQTVSINHLIEFRKDVEGLVASVAAERATEEDIEQLKQLLAKASTHLSNDASDWEAFIRIDRKLHLEIAKITGNPLYIYILQTIHDNIHRYYERFLPKSETNRHEEYQNLCEIVQAIEDGDSTRACSLARTHVFRFASYMDEVKNVNKKSLQLT